MTADTPTPDLAACEAFAAFWCSTTGAPHLTLTAIIPDGTTTTRTFTPAAWAEMRRFVAAAQSEGRNVYFQPNEAPAACVSKAAKAVMVAALCRHADIDPEDEQFPLAEERDRLHRLSAVLAADPDMPPTVILDSGNGIQPLWVMERETLDPLTLDRVEDENRAIEAALGAAGTHDVSRLLRLPGTVNYPNRKKVARGRGVGFARVIAQTGRTYRATDAARLGAHLVQLVRGKGLLRDPHSGAAEQGGAGDPVLERLYKALRFQPALAARWAGDMTGLTSGRSSLALALARLLRAANFDRDDCFHLLRLHPVVGVWCQEKGDLNGARELHRTWERACQDEGDDGEASSWPEPQRDLATADAAPPPALDIALFPGDWRRWITRAAEGAGAPPDYVACALLATVGACIGNARWGSPWQGWAHPPVVNVACIGLPSAGKSPAIDAVAGPAGALAADLNDDWLERQRAWNTDAQEAKERRNLWEAEVKLAVKDGRTPPPQPAGAQEPERPRKRRLYSTDPTIEAARDLSAFNPRGLLLHSDELSGWIAGMDRYGKGGGGTDRAFWLQAYEGKRWLSDRVKDGDDARDVAHLTWGIVGGIQPDRLASLLMAGDDDGLAARFIYTWPAPLPGISEPPSGRLLRFDLKDRLRPLRELPMADAEEPVILQFTPAAVDALQDWRRTAKAMERDAAGLFLSWLGKTPGMVVRLSVTFLHLGWLTTEVGTPPPAVVDLDAVARALGFIADYAVPMARRAFGEAALPEAERDARILARWLLRQVPIPTKVNARELRRMAGAPGIRTAERIEAALTELAELDWVRPAPGRDGASKGRQRADWLVNPRLREGGE